MKKVISIMLVLLALVGCSSSHVTKLSAGDDVIFKGPDNVSYTKEDMYDCLKTVDAEVVIQDILEKIALKSPDVDIEDLNKQVDELIELYESMGYESYIISQYGSMDVFRDYYLSELLVQELGKVYVKENYDSLKADKPPVKMQMAIFETVEDAQKCIDDFNNGNTFDMAAVNNNSTNAPASSIYLDSDESLIYEVKDYINSTDTIGVSSIITYTTTSTDSEGKEAETNTYYVLNIESRDPEEFKDEYISLLAMNVSTDTVKSYFLSTHDISFYDQDIYLMVSNAYEVLK